MCVSCIKLWFYWCCCSFLPFAFNVVITRKRDWERCHVPFPDYVEPIENCIDEASLEEVTGLLSTSNPLRNKFLFSSWMKWQTFLTWIMSNPKKNRQQLQMTRRSIYRTKEIWLGRQPEAYYTSVCLRSYISVCSIDRFLYYVYIFYREGFKKSKWKFKMAFALKGGAVSRGSRVPHTYFEKWFF